MNLRQNVLWILLFPILLSIPLGAQTDFPDHVSLVDSLRNQNLASPSHYLAAGNSHVKKRQYAQAILAYERGLKLSPTNDQLTNNLEYARKEAGIENKELPGFFLLRFWRAAGAWLGASTCLWLAVILWWLAIIGGSLWYLRRHHMLEIRRFALLPGAGVCLALALIFLFMGISRNNFLQNTKEAILMDATQLRVAPGPDATIEESLSAGHKLGLIDRFENYVKITMPDGRKGWIRDDVVAII